MNTAKVNEMVQTHLLEHGQLHYDVFLIDFIKVVVRIFYCTILYKIYSGIMCIYYKFDSIENSNR